MSVVVYEVNPSVPVARADEFRAWILPHIEEILALEGFVGATLLEEGERDGRQHFVVHYRLRDAAAFARYEAGHAPRLRADGLERFGGELRATRRVLELHREWGRS